MSLCDYDPFRVFPRLELGLRKSDELLHLISLPFRMMKTGCRTKWLKLEDLV